MPGLRGENEGIDMTAYYDDAAPGRTGGGRVKTIPLRGGAMIIATATEFQSLRDRARHRATLATSEDDRIDVLNVADVFDAGKVDAGRGEGTVTLTSRGLALAEELMDQEDAAPDPDVAALVEAAKTILDETEGRVFIGTYGNETPVVSSELTDRLREAVERIERKGGGK